MMNKNKKNKKKPKNKFLNNFLLWGIIIGVCILVATNLNRSDAEKIQFSEFRDNIRTLDNALKTKNVCEDKGYVWNNACYKPSGKITKYIKEGNTLTGFCEHEDPKRFCFDENKNKIVKFIVNIDDVSYEKIYPFIVNTKTSDTDNESPSIYNLRNSSDTPARLPLQISLTT